MTSDASLPARPVLKEFVMRFAPVAIAISMLAAVSGSAGLANGQQTDARAQVLVAEGEAQLSAGDVQAAIDSFEAALVIEPGQSDIYVHLAQAARQDGLQGKAIRYYREALKRDPENVAAISGEGEALAEKGAIDNAREILVRVQDLCSSECMEATELAAAIERGPIMPVVTAEAATSEVAVSAN
jgi:tetratricopeptide (TPR) repeat protein